MTFGSLLEKLKSKTDLTKEDISTIVRYFEEKKLNDKEIKDLVSSWREKGETPFELNSLAEIVNLKQKQNENFKDSIDMCGTGGDKLNTFNISTLSAILASSCGANVIKHSGRSTTSISGSVDVLEFFGIDLNSSSEVKEDCFKETRLMFVSSKILRDLLGNVKKVCKEINIPGFVNLLGPLTNPYKTNHHLLGVSNIKWGELLASTLQLQGDKNALVVCSQISENIFLDELSFCGVNYLWKVNGSQVLKEKLLPGDLGENNVDVNDLTIKDINESKVVFEGVLKDALNVKDNIDSKINVVALNTGAALYLTKKVNSIANGYKLAQEHLNTGKTWEHFQNFINSMKVRT